MFELMQHTADIRMRVTASSREELFADALRGLMAVVEPEDVTAKPLSANVELTAPDVTVLLIDFLNEALTLAHVRRAVYSDISFETLTDTSMVGTLRGFPAAGFREDVKAVTYHEAEVVAQNGQWSTMVVFDI